MANRRKFIAGLGALATGSAAAMGTGAFTSVSADRNLEVETTGDSSALLALEEGSSGNQEYVSTTEAGTISIDISTENGVGLNNNATTKIADLFRITNQGTQDVAVWLSGVPDGVYFSAQGDFANSDGDYTDANGNTFGGPTQEFTESRHFADGDFKNSDGAGAPVLKPGQTIKVELFRPGYGDPPEVDTDAPITIEAEDTDNL